MKNWDVDEVMVVLLLLVVLLGMGCGFQAIWNDRLVEETAIHAGYCQTTVQGSSSLVWEKCQ